MTGLDRVREAIDLDRGMSAPQLPIVLCGPAECSHCAGTGWISVSDSFGVMQYVCVYCGGEGVRT